MPCDLSQQICAGKYHSDNGHHHRRIYEPGGSGPPDSGKAIIFQAKAKFFGQKPAAKNEKKLFVFIKRKTEIHSV